MARKSQKPRPRYVQTVAYLRRDQIERLRATVARTQVPGARLIRAGVDLILEDPALVQSSLAPSGARR